MLVGCWVSYHNDYPTMKYARAFFFSFQSRLLERLFRKAKIFPKVFVTFNVQVNTVHQKLLSTPLKERMNK